jgi:hypothetical protein
MTAQRKRRHATSRTAIAHVFVVALVVLALPVHVAAQDSDAASVANIAKRVALDPTTYAPALVSYYSTLRDWQTSQPFFEHGANEMNPGFTISGRPNDTPVGYGEGKRRILRDTLFNLEISAVGNVSSQVVERMLIARYGSHHRAIRVAGWVERISLSSYLTYQWSVMHVRQTDLNQELARQRGY